MHKAAEQGDAKAQFYLGVAYDDGAGVPENDREAVKWYLKAAEQGHARAQSNLDVRYDRDEGAPENDREEEQRTQVSSNVDVRSSEPKDVSVAFEHKKTQYNSLIHETAARHRVDANLVTAIISVESNFNPWAVSSKGCMGLMQLHPDTAVRFGVQNIFDPAENIEGGVKFLSFLLQEFKGNLELVLAGYNAGEHAVARHKGIPPYRETQQYVSKVKNLYRAMGNSPSEQTAVHPRDRGTDSHVSLFGWFALVWLFITVILVASAKP